MAAAPQQNFVAEAGVCSGQGCGPGCCDDAHPYGPVLGPGDEYLCDGGDYVSQAGVKADWSIVGLEQEDAISHYDTVDGRVIVEPSNRVCIYARRFAAVRRVMQPLVDEQPVFVNQATDQLSLARAVESLPVISQKQRNAPAVDMGSSRRICSAKQQAGGLENLLATMDAFDVVAPMATLAILRTGEVSDASGAVERLKQNAVTLTGDQAPEDICSVCCRRMQKSAHYTLALCTVRKAPETRSCAVQTGIEG